jgi:hypothetical protein
MKLAECSDFNLVDAFSMLDHKSLGWVSAPQIFTMFLDHEVFAHKDDIYNYTRRFDRDMDSKLLYSDFCESFTPKDPYYAHAVNQRKPKYIHVKEVPKKYYFADETRNYLFQLFKTHFLTEEKIELAKKKVARSHTFTIHDAFSCMDTYKQGHLTKDDFLRILERNGLHPAESELTLLCARFDKRLTGCISYGEFMDEILEKKSLLGDVYSLNLLRKVE